MVAVLLVSGVAGCGGGESSSPTAPTSVETATPVCGPPGRETVAGCGGSSPTGPTQTGTSPNGVCAVTSAQATQAPNFAIQIIPTEDPLFGVFYKYTKAFGMSLLASEDFPDDRLAWVTTIAVEYLDNNEDGIPDDVAVSEWLARGGASMLLTRSEEESQRLYEIHKGPSGVLHYVGHPQPRAAHESTPHTTLGTGDASLEEVLHLIQNGGYGKVYRDLEPGIGSGYNLLHDAMDVARGGRFKSPPATYPAGAWNTYDDASCDYACGDVPCAVEIQRRLGSRLRDHR